MKTTCSLLAGLALLLGAGSLHAATPDGADSYLVSPWDYEGHTIRLNVVFVRPANFESPLPDIIFYHAMTETLDHRPGGEILIAVPKKDSEHFARFYGMDGRNRNMHILSGTLLVAHHHHPHRDHPEGPDAQAPAPDSGPAVSGTNANNNEHRDRHEPGTWFVDYKGLNKDLFAQNPDIDLPAGGGPDDHHGDGPGGGGPAGHAGPGNNGPGGPPPRRQ